MPPPIVLVHGAFEGAWCFDAFAATLSKRGFKCHAPDLRYHGTAGAADPALAGTGIADYVRDVSDVIARLSETPVLIGHSMGGIVAQKLAAAGHARACVLLASVGPWGVLPATDWERSVGKGLMSTGAFWERSLQPNYDIAKNDALASLDVETGRAVFDRFGAESGQALFEMFFWMFDNAAATRVDAQAIAAPLLVVAGADDKVISAATGCRIAEFYGAKATFHEIAGRGHMLPLEPGCDKLAESCADWIAQNAA